MRKESLIISKMPETCIIYYFVLEYLCEVASLALTSIESITDQPWKVPKTLYMSCSVKYSARI